MRLAHGLIQSYLFADQQQQGFTLPKVAAVECLLVPRGQKWVCSAISNTDNGTGSAIRQYPSLYLQLRSLWSND